ncbi:MAG: hypothetical protein H6619_03050 [Deltaproteobacteria bacterium]|nr:hypothetical protein [Deltaproteobacteria bacterium]
MIAKYLSSMLIVMIFLIDIPAFASGTNIEFQCYKDNDQPYSGSDPRFKLKKASTGTIQALAIATQKFCTDQEAKDEKCVAKLHSNDTIFEIEKGTGELECTKTSCCECKKARTANSDENDIVDPIIIDAKDEIEALAAYLFD